MQPRGPWIRLVLVAGALAVALLMVDRKALAASGKLVPLEPEMPAETAEPQRARFMEAVAKGIGSAGFEEISPREVRARLDAQNVQRCSSGGCAEQLVSAFAADGAVRVTIDKTNKNFHFTVEVLDATGRIAGKKGEDRCEICTHNEAALGLEKLVRLTCSAAAAQLSRAADEDGPGGPRSSPQQWPGNRPLAPAGSKDEDEPALRPARPAKPVEAPRTVDKPVAEPERPHVAVAESPSPTVENPRPHSDLPARKDGDDRHPSSIPYGTLAYAAIGVTAVALVGTIVFSAYASKDTQPSCDKPDPRHSCPDIYKGNTGPAVTFGILTVLAAGAGALLWYMDIREHRKHEVSVLVAPTLGGAAAVASFRF